MTIGRFRMGQKKIFRKLARRRFCCNILIITLSLQLGDRFLYSKNRTDTVSKPVSYSWKFLIIDLIIS
jgi:hypothetical protein